MKKLIALVLAVMLLVPAFAMADNVIRIGLDDVFAHAHELADDGCVQLHEPLPLGGIVAICIFGDLAKQCLGRVGNHCN